MQQDGRGIIFFPLGSLGTLFSPVWTMLQSFLTLRNTTQGAWAVESSVSLREKMKLISPCWNLTGVACAVACTNYSTLKRERKLFLSR